MSRLEDIQMEYEVGQAIFKELFEMEDSQIKEKMNSILSKDYNYMFISNSDCIRTIRNGEPEKIEFWYYDCIRINWNGIFYQPEHGPEKRLVRFGKHFKL